MSGAANKRACADLLEQSAEQMNRLNRPSGVRSVPRKPYFMSTPPTKLGQRASMPLPTHGASPSLPVGRTTAAYRRQPAPPSNIVPTGTVSMHNILAQRLTTWKRWVQNPLVLQWVESGFSLLWKTDPPPPHFAKNHPSTLQHKRFVDHSVRSPCK